jgi:neutral amino acid transport system permease protein
MAISSNRQHAARPAARGPRGQRHPRDLRVGRRGEARRAVGHWLALVLVALSAVVALPAAAAAQDPPEPGPTAPPAEGEPTQEPSETPGSETGEEPVGVVRGTIRYEEDDERVAAEGVSITVESDDGTFSETVETNQRGQFEVGVPAEGTYQVSIDTDTLPEGVQLEDEDRTTAEARVRPPRPGLAAFPLTTGDEEAQNSFLVRALRLGVQGVRFGLILAMASIGLSLIFGTTGLVNFSHGEMVTFGALIAYLFNVTLGMPILIAAPLAIAVGGLFGAGYNRGVWRPLRSRGTGLVAMLVVSIGAGMLMRYIFLYQFGGRSRGYDVEEQRAMEIGPLDIVPRDLWLIGLSVLLLVAVALFLQLTLAGKAMRAVADNRDLAEASGIDVERVIAWVWIAGGALAAVGGVFNALAEDVTWQMGFQMLLLLFASVILGGLGTAFGALVGGISIGLLYQLSTLFIDSVYKTTAALLVLILVLLVRPHGILGQPERVG